MLNEIKRLTAQSIHRHNRRTRPNVDQRLIYYILARSIKPRLIFQSGTAGGVGACLLAEALLRNEQEGIKGLLVTTDIDPTQGYLITEPWNRVAKLIIEDTTTVLKTISRPIDLFVHDTDPDTLARKEFPAVLPLLRAESMMLSTWHTPYVISLAREQGRPVFLYKDEPADHWCNGASMALIGRVTLI